MSSQPKAIQGEGSGEAKPEWLVPHSCRSHGEMPCLKSGTTKTCTEHFSIPNGVSTQFLIPAVVRAYSHYIATPNSRASGAAPRDQVQTISLIAKQSTMLTHR